MNNMQNWYGIGVKGGGTLGVAGFETLEGSVTNLGFPRHSHGLNVSSLRLGIGLGASVGATIVFIFNCGNLQSLHKTNCEDWSINISFGGKWSDIAKALKNLGTFTTAMKILKAGKAVPGDIDTFRNAASYIYSTVDMVKNKPQIVAIDIPGAGVGLEASAHMLYGTIHIGDLVDSGSPTEAAPVGVRRGTM